MAKGQSFPIASIVSLIIGIFLVLISFYMNDNIIGPAYFWAGTITIVVVIVYFLIKA